MSGIRKPSSTGRVGSSGTGASGSGAFCFFSTGASATTVAFGAAHDIIATAIPTIPQAL